MLVERIIQAAFSGKRDRFAERRLLKDFPQVYDGPGPESTPPAAVNGARWNRRAA
jgi:hypothetical protein